MKLVFQTKEFGVVVERSTYVRSTSVRYAVGAKVIDLIPHVAEILFSLKYNMVWSQINQMKIKLHRHMWVKGILISMLHILMPIKWIIVVMLIKL